VPNPRILRFRYKVLIRNCKKIVFEVIFALFSLFFNRNSCKTGHFWPISDQYLSHSVFNFFRATFFKLENFRDHVRMPHARARFLAGKSTLPKFLMKICKNSDWLIRGVKWFDLVYGILRCSTILNDSSLPGAKFSTYSLYTEKSFSAVIETI